MCIHNIYICIYIYIKLCNTYTYIICTDDNPWQAASRWDLHSDKCKSVHRGHRGRHSRCPVLLGWQVSDDGCAPCVGAYMASRAIPCLMCYTHCEKNQPDIGATQLRCTFLHPTYLNTSGRCTEEAKHLSMQCFHTTLTATSMWELPPYPIDIMTMHVEYRKKASQHETSNESCFLVTGTSTDAIASGVGVGLSRSIKFTESYLDRTLPDSETTRDSETAIPNYDSETMSYDSETISPDSETIRLGNY